ncbi:MAG: hypothetical protein ACXVFN_02750 [Solirubrobacteraceae bacterium]
MSAGPPSGGSLAQVDGIDRVARPLAHELGQSVAVLSGALAQLRDCGGADPTAVLLLSSVEGRLRRLTEELLAVAGDGEQP